ncbi:MAG: HU family DNA-binding protein [Tannerellaceae bacterium]|nr:HU family DNA-binding protein [Tannerellaceae bacterium]
MPAFYKFVKKPGQGSKNSKQELYPRFVPSDTVKKEEFLEAASAMSGFSKAIIAGILQLFGDLIVRYLSRGKSVTLEGIGTFSLTLTAPPVTNKSEIRSESIRFKDVTFRSAFSLRHRLKDTSFYRKEEYRPDTCYSPEQRKERLLKYLELYTTFTRKNYMALNKCSKTTAVNDLKLFLNEKIIKKSGPLKGLYEKAVKEDPGLEE